MVCDPCLEVACADAEKLWVYSISKQRLNTPSCSPYFNPASVMLRLKWLARHTPRYSHDHLSCVRMQLEDSLANRCRALKKLVIGEISDLLKIMWANTARPRTLLDLSIRHPLFVQ